MSMYMKETNILNNYKIIKELGHGMIGTVYKISTKTNSKLFYALKIEHVEKKDFEIFKSTKSTKSTKTTKTTKSKVWREINFYLKFGYKYPEQFVQLCEYDFISNCSHIQTYSYEPETFDKKIQIRLKKLASSPYCIRKVYELVSGDLDQIIHTLTHKQIYSMIVQIGYTIKILHSHGYTHSDIHSKNIGWIKTNKKIITIKMSGKNNIDVKTFGYIFKLMDFGEIAHKNDITTNYEKKQFLLNTQYELPNLKYMLVDNKMWDHINKHNIKVNFSNVYEEFKKTEEYDGIKNFSSDKHDQIFLFDILYPLQHQKILFGNAYKKTIQRKLYLPIEDVLFFVKLSGNIDSTISYFHSKIN